MRCSYLLYCKNVIAPDLLHLRNPSALPAALFRYHDFKAEILADTMLSYHISAFSEF